MSKNNINYKYNIIYSAQNRLIAINNLFQYENDFYSKKIGDKSNCYDFSTCAELLKPTINFIIAV